MKIILLLLMVLVLVAIPAFQNYIGANLRQSYRLARVLQFDDTNILTRNRDSQLDDVCRWSTVRFTDNQNEVELRIPTKTPWMSASKANDIEDISVRLHTVGFRQYLISNYIGYAFGDEQYQNNSLILKGSKIIQAPAPFVAQRQKKR